MAVTSNESASLPRRQPASANVHRNLPLIGILLVAVGARLYQIGWESLWMDEILSVGYARNPLTPGSLTRPLYYVLLRLWMVFGHSDAWMRGLSAVLGVATVYAIYLLGDRLLNRAAGLTAALMFALSPLSLEHSQEVRMYALSALLGVLGCLALLRVLEQKTPRTLFEWAVARYLMLLTTPLNVLILLPDLVMLRGLLRSRRDLRVAGLKTALLLGLLWLPSAFISAVKAPKFMSGWVTVVPRPDLWAVLSKLMGFTAYWPKSTADYWRAEPIFPSEAVAWFYRAYILVMACLLVYSLLARPASEGRGRIALWAFLPFAALFVISWTSGSLWLDRYLSFIAPYFILLLATGFVRLWRVVRPAAVLVALVYLLGVGGAVVRYYGEQDREDWRGAIGVINREQRPADGIVLYASFCGPAIWHYYRGNAPNIGLEIPTARSYDVFTPEQVARAVHETATRLPAGTRRVWLLYWHFGPELRHVVFRRAVQENFAVQSHRSFVGLDLFALDRPATERGTTGVK